MKATDAVLFSAMFKSLLWSPPVSSLLHCNIMSNWQIKVFQAISHTLPHIHITLYSVHFKYFIYLTSMANLESPVNPPNMSLGCGGQLAYLEETHTGTERISTEKGWKRIPGNCLVWHNSANHCTIQFVKKIPYVYLFSCTLINVVNMDI